jgi:Family of unknown function (DUF5706)
MQTVSTSSTCTECGAESPSDKRFCADCGAPLPTGDIAAVSRPSEQDRDASDTSKEVRIAGVLQADGELEYPGRWLRTAFNTSRDASNYTAESIRFADTKAGFAMTLFGLYVSALLNIINWRHFLLGSITWAQPYNIFQHAVAWAFVISSAVAVYRGISVVYPRTTHRAAKGLLFWSNVVAYETPMAYSDAFLAEDEMGIVRAVIEQNFYLCRVADNKYRRLHLLFLQVGITVALGGVALVFLR